MAKNLTIILGAGASTGSVENGVTSHRPIIPPITKEIFSPNFDYISRKYEDVKSATVGITAEIKDGKSLEDFLKDKLGAMHGYETLSAHRKRQLNQLPLYLQDLFSDISRQLKISTFYSKFVNELFDRRNIKVTFLTLNYDLLLDYAIEQVADTKFINFDSYIKSSQKWVLIKPHGSVNWFRQIKNYSQTGDTLESWKAIVKKINILQDLDDNLAFLDLENGFKEGFVKNIPYYPALAVPNADYHPIYPSDSHRILLDERLKECENFLIIGFSAYDQDMLKILNKNVNNVKRLLIVGKADVSDVYKRLKKSVTVFSTEKPQTVQYGSGFGPFLKGIDFSNFLDSL